MSGVRHVALRAAADGMRLDRWFRREFPGIAHGHLSRLLRTGQIRLDGRRCKAGARLAAGQILRLPPLSDGETHREPQAPRPAPDAKAVEALAERVIHCDDAVVAVDKPAGLPVQGGTGIAQHLDAMLDGLRFGSVERPRLVHRLDRDTSGVLLLARTLPAARALQASFRRRAAHKTYWALVAGVPRLAGQELIALPLARKGASGSERSRIDRDVGRKAETRMRVVDRAGRIAAWLELEPLTGRTHQLRAHCAAIGHPILGDGKYGGRQAFVAGRNELARRLHLHARRVRLPHPDGGTLEVAAPLPADLEGSWRAFGFAREGAP